MFEVGLGVVLAALFVAAYILITAFFRRDSHELGGLYPPVTLNPVDTTHSIGGAKSPRALTSGEGDDRHSRGARHEARDDKDHKSKRN